MADVPQRELYLLVLRFLEGSPCTEAYDALRREAEAHGLLGERIDWRGCRAAASFANAAGAAGSLPPPNHLQGLLSQLLALSHAQRPAQERVDMPSLTLLGSGPRSLFTLAVGDRTEAASSEAAAGGGRRLGAACGAGLLGTDPPPPSEHWSRSYRAPLHPVQDASCRCKPSVGTRPGLFVPALLARELGVRPRQLRCVHRLLAASSATSSHAAARGAGAQSETAASFLQARDSAPHESRDASSGGRTLALAALRGHLCAAYCVVFDRTGRRLVTGADDGHVKTWCTATGLLQHTLRGHAAEITDVVVSPDNVHVVSSSLDATVRVWRLSRGEPVAVLMHDGPINAIAFSPNFGPGADPDSQPAEEAGTGVAAQAACRGSAAGAAGAGGAAGAAGGGGAAWAVSPAGVVAPFLVTVTANGATQLFDAMHWDAPPLQLAMSTRHQPAEPAPTGAGGMAAAAPPVVLLGGGSGAGGGGGEGDGGVDGFVTTTTCCSIASSGLWACVGTTVAPYLYCWDLKMARQVFDAAAAARELRTADGGLPPPAPVTLPRPVALRCHQAEITAVAWSPNRHQLICGSRDGTASVWTWDATPHTSPLVGMLQLKPAVAVVGAHTRALNTHSGARPPALWVDAVGWSCDGRLAFTAESLRKQTRDEPCLSSCVRCWMICPSEATVLSVFNESAFPTFVLRPHPADPYLLATGSYDGSVSRWLATTGELLSRFTAPEPALSDPNASAVEVFDGTFSPDGSCFAAINASGVAWLSGLDGGAAGSIRRAPYAQFFSSDFHSLAHDAAGNALDVQFGREPHRVPRQPICDERGGAHAAEHQRPASTDRLLLSGWAAEQAQRARAAGALLRAAEQFEDQTAAAGAAQTHGKQPLVARGGASSGGGGGHSGAAGLHWGGAGRAAGGVNIAGGGGAGSRRPLPLRDVELLNQPIDEGSSGSEWAPPSEGSGGRRHGRRLGDSAGSASSVDDDASSAESLSGSGGRRRGRSRRASRRSRAALRAALAMDMAGSDEEAQARAVQRMMRRVARPERQSRRRRVSTRHYADGVGTVRATLRHAAQRRSSQMVAGSDTDEDEAESVPLSARQVAALERAERAVAAAERAAALAAAEEEAAISRAWLLRGRAERAEYVPQVGDRVVYLRRAHEAALAVRPDEGGVALAGGAGGQAAAGGQAGAGGSHEPMAGVADGEVRGAPPASGSESGPGPAGASAGLDTEGSASAGVAGSASAPTNDQTPTPAPDADFTPPDADFTPPDADFTPPDADFTPPDADFTLPDAPKEAEDDATAPAPAAPPAAPPSPTGISVAATAPPAANGSGSEAPQEGLTSGSPPLTPPPFVLHPRLPGAVWCLVTKVQVVPGPRLQSGAEGAPVLRVSLRPSLHGASAGVAPAATEIPAGEGGAAGGAATEIPAGEGFAGDASGMAVGGGAEGWVVTVRGPGSGCPDFLLLEGRYAHALQQWHAAAPGTLLRAPFLIRCGERGAEYAWYRGKVACVRGSGAGQACAQLGGASEQQQGRGTPASSRPAALPAGGQGDAADVFESIGVVWEEEPEPDGAVWPPAHEGFVPDPKLESKHLLVRLPTSAAPPRTTAGPPLAGLAPAPAATAADAGRRQGRGRDAGGGAAGAPGAASSPAAAAAAAPQRLLRQLADSNAPSSRVRRHSGLRAGSAQPPSAASGGEQDSVTEEDSDCSEEAPAAAAAGTSAAPCASGAVAGGDGREDFGICPDVSEGDADMEFVSPWEIELSSVPGFSAPQLDTETAAMLRSSLEELARTAAAAPFRCLGSGSAHLAAPWGAAAPAGCAFPSCDARTPAPCGSGLPPVGIELLLRRLDRGYYRQAAAVAHDAELCGAAACVDPASAALAQAVAPVLLAAASGGAWRPMYDLALGGFRRSVVTAACEAEDARVQARSAAAGAGEVVAQAEVEEAGEAEAQRKRAGKRRAVAPPSDESDGRVRGGSESESDEEGLRRRSRRTAGRAGKGGERSTAACGAPGGLAPSLPEPSSRQQRAARRRADGGVDGEEWQEWPGVVPSDGMASGRPTHFKIVLRLDHEAREATWVSVGAAKSIGAHQSEEEEEEESHQPAKRRRAR